MRYGTLLCLDVEEPDRRKRKPDLPRNPNLLHFWPLSDSFTSFRHSQARWQLKQAQVQQARAVLTRENQLQMAIRLPALPHPLHRLCHPNRRQNTILQHRFRRR